MLYLRHMQQHQQWLLQFQHTLVAPFTQSLGILMALLNNIQCKITHHFVHRSHEAYKCCPCHQGWE